MTAWRDCRSGLEAGPWLLDEQRNTIRLGARQISVSTAERLGLLLRERPQAHLDLSGAPLEGRDKARAAAALTGVLVQNGGLTALTVGSSRNKALWQASVPKILRANPQLQALTLHGEAWLSDCAGRLARIAGRQPTLQRLTLQGCSAATATALLAALPTRRAGVSHLVLDAIGTKGCTSRFLASLIEELPKCRLRRLTLVGIKGFGRMRCARLVDALHAASCPTLLDLPQAARSEVQFQQYRVVAGAGPRAAGDVFAVELAADGALRPVEHARRGQ